MSWTANLPKYRSHIIEEYWKSRELVVLRKFYPTFPMNHTVQYFKVVVEGESLLLAMNFTRTGCFWSLSDWFLDLMICQGMAVPSVRCCVWHGAIDDVGPSAVVFVFSPGMCKYSLCCNGVPACKTAFLRWDPLPPSPTLRAISCTDCCGPMYVEEALWV